MIAFPSIEGVTMKHQPAWSKWIDRMDAIPLLSFETAILAIAITFVLFHR